MPNANIHSYYYPVDVPEQRSLYEDHAYDLYVAADMQTTLFRVSLVAIYASVGTPLAANPIRSGVHLSKIHSNRQKIEMEHRSVRLEDAEARILQRLTTQYDIAWQYTRRQDSAYAVVRKSTHDIACQAKRGDTVTFREVPALNIVAAALHAIITPKISWLS